MIALLAGCVRRVNSHYNNLNSSPLLNLPYSVLDYFQPDKFTSISMLLNNVLTYAKVFKFVRLIPSIFYTGQPTPLNINSWCRGDYQELLPGRYLNGRTSEILCHDRESGLSLSYLLE